MLIETHFHKPFDPVAEPEAVVTAGPVRFTVLKPEIIRMEYSPDGRFEDRPSQPFWYRRQPVPAFTTKEDDSRLVIETDALRLEYDREAGAFTSSSLTVEVKSLGTVYHYGDVSRGNLLGTTRTLDETRGPILLEQGLNSRQGWVVVDDSDTLVFNESGWLEPRHAAPGTLDLYFFGYGHEYLRTILDYQELTGRVPLLPRWALGNWWSRYWNYTDVELKNLMLEFETRRIPLSVCIVDMDWHLTETGNASSGWTGYTWNRDYFPDPQGFINWLHTHNLRTALNLHPASGVWPHEEQYEDMARAMGIDPASQQPVEFDIVDPKFMQAYLEILHHPIEALGVDFWWMDWQQGKESKVAGLDPLWWLNHLHFYDLGRNGKRPFVFSRWGGLGNHRYPIGFSGDTEVEWPVLAYQPYFTSNAANVGYGWWSHDIGGHYFGMEDRELYTRWVQFGVFSPIFRLHCTKDPYLERRPWGYDEQVEHIVRQFMQLRHALIPYIYTLSWRNEKIGAPPILPMYYQYPELDEAYNAQHQYILGGDLLVAPVTSPNLPDLDRAKQAVWLPEGSWFHFFSGEFTQGGGWQADYPLLGEMPVYARAGAIIPLASGPDVFSTNPPEHLDLVVFPGLDNRFELFEDDGDTTRYREGHFRVTPIVEEWGGDWLRLLVQPAEGEAAAGPERRNLRFFFKGIVDPDSVEVTVNGKQVDFNRVYAGLTLTVEGVQAGVDETVEVLLAVRAGELIDRTDRRAARVVDMLRRFRMRTYAKSRLQTDLPEILQDVRKLGKYAPVLSDDQMAALVETITGAGSFRLPHSGSRDRVVLWNRRQEPGFTYRQSQMIEGWGATDTTEGGDVPAFQVILPEEAFPHERASWQVAVDYFGLVKVVYSNQ